MIAPLSTGASHTVLGLAGAAVGMLVVWIAGCALAPARPPAERLAWGVVAMLAVAWSTLWQPVLGVSWLGHRTLMAVIVVVGMVVVAARTRAWRTAPDVRKPVVLVAALALAVSVLPLVWGPSAVVPISDMQFHEGWIRQLVGGLPEPSGVYAHVPNSYPWLYHALAAWLELLPGGMVEVYWALQAFAVGSLALGTWLLARELGLSERPATWAVGFASLAAGVGWIWVHEPVAVVSSSRYGLVHGDFLVGPAATPALANMPAIMPRDLALALFPLTVWFALRAVAGRRMRDVAAAGALAGCLLLIGPVGAVVAVLVCGPVALRRRIPVRHAAAAVAVAAVVVAPWLGRVAAQLRAAGWILTPPAAAQRDRVTGAGGDRRGGCRSGCWAWSGCFAPARRASTWARWCRWSRFPRCCVCSRACCPATAWPAWRPSSSCSGTCPSSRWGWPCRPGGRRTRCWRGCRAGARSCWRRRWSRPPAPRRTYDRLGSTWMRTTAAPGSSSGCEY